MFFADMHCDTISRILEDQKKGQKVCLRENDYHLDLLKMKKANYLLQHFALFLDKGCSDDPKADGLALLACFKEQMEANKDLIRQATTYEDIMENKKNGLLSAILSVEEGEITGGTPDTLEAFAKEGVKMIALTWNHKNKIGAPNLIPDANGKLQISGRNPEGLTENGINYIQEMERLHMIVDVSHLSDGGFWDVVHNTKSPFVASHSNAASLCPFSRNLTDDMIRALGERGGVMGINFCGDFLTFPEHGHAEPSRISAILAHMHHIVNVGGIEVLGLGTDYDGIGCELELSDASYMPMLTEAMLASGFSASEVEKILYQNVLRLYK